MVIHAVYHWFIGVSLVSYVYICMRIVIDVLHVVLSELFHIAYFLALYLIFLFVLTMCFLAAGETASSCQIMQRKKVVDSQVLLLLIPINLQLNGQ